MMYDVLQLIVLLLNVASFGYYLYLAGKMKGLEIAIKTVLQNREEAERDA